LRVIFRARQFEFSFPRPAVVMGVVNVTPDSFSDGGKFLNAEAAVAHALKLLEQGAEILDVGGESTRPGATPVSEAEELRRVIPVVEKLAAAVRAAAHPALISIDTQKPAVARAALAAGASLVNDIAANRSNDAMARVVEEFGAGYVCMHMQGSPTTMQFEPIYADVVREVGEFFAERLRRLAAAGVTPEQVLLDAGIGFGKTVAQNLALLAGQKSFLKLGRPLLLGVSRKSFLGKISGAEVNERLPAALACTTLALADGVQFFRTHDVAETVQAVRAAEQILAREG
jgi:dihydropteroate synthase